MRRSGRRLPERCTVELENAVKGRILQPASPDSVLTHGSNHHRALCHKPLTRLQGSNPPRDDKLHCFPTFFLTNIPPKLGLPVRGDGDHYAVAGHIPGICGFTVSDSLYPRGRVTAGDYREGGQVWAFACMSDYKIPERRAHPNHSWRRPRLLRVTWSHEADWMTVGTPAGPCPQVANS